MPTSAPGDLIQLQRLFHAAISGGGDPASLEALAPRLLCTGSLSVQEGIAAYQGSVKGKLIRCLQEIYPVCERLVGEPFFAAMASRYASAHASTSPDLGDYGGELPAFLRAFTPAAGLPYLADVAQLEWHWHRVFNAPDENGLDLTALSQVAPEQWEHLLFQLPQASALLASAYPVDRIWAANQPDATDSDPIDLNQGGATLLIWRDGVDTRMERLDTGAWRLLQGFAARMPFGQLCSELDLGSKPLEEDGQLRVDAAVLLPMVVARGWVSGFEVGCS